MQTAYEVYGYGTIVFFRRRIVPDVAFLPFDDRITPTQIPRAGTYQRVRTGASYACSEKRFRERIQRSFSHNQDLAEYPSVDEEHAAVFNSMVYDPSRQGQHFVSFDSLKNVELPGVALIDVLLGRADLLDSKARPLAKCQLPWFTLNVGAWGVEMLPNSVDIVRFPVRSCKGNTLPLWALAHAAAWAVLDHLWRFRCLGPDTEKINKPAQFLRAFDILRKIRIFGLLDLDNPDEPDTRAFRIHYEIL